MKAPFLSSPLPWIVHRRDWKDLRQALSPLWSYSLISRIDVSGIKKGRGFAAGCVRLTAEGCVEGGGAAALRAEGGGRRLQK